MTLTTGELPATGSTIEIGDRLCVGDPCYGRATETVDGCQGTWTVHTDTSDEGRWGIRVAQLRLVRAGAGPAVSEMEEGVCGVDSGQMAAWCEERHPLGLDDLYDDICALTLADGPPTSGALPGIAASSTGYGDGCYPLRVARDGAGRPVEVRVVFLWDDATEAAWAAEDAA